MGQSEMFEEWQRAVVEEMERRLPSIRTSDARRIVGVYFGLAINLWREGYEPRAAAARIEMASIAKAMIKLCEEAKSCVDTRH